MGKFNEACSSAGWGHGVWVERKLEFPTQLIINKLIVESLQTSHCLKSSKLYLDFYVWALVFSLIPCRLLDFIVVSFEARHFFLVFSLIPCGLLDFSLFYLKLRHFLEPDRLLGFHFYVDVVFMFMYFSLRSQFCSFSWILFNTSVRKFEIWPSKFFYKFFLFFQLKFPYGFLLLVTLRLI